MSSTGVRYVKYWCQVSSDNMSSTGVRYQVSDQGQVITCQVPESDIKYQVSGVK